MKKKVGIEKVRPPFLGIEWHYDCSCLLWKTCCYEFRFSLRLILPVVVNTEEKQLTSALLVGDHYMTFAAPVGFQVFVVIATLSMPDNGRGSPSAANRDIADRGSETTKRGQTPHSSMRATTPTPAADRTRGDKRCTGETGRDSGGIDAMSVAVAFAPLSDRTALRPPLSMPSKRPSVIVFRRLRPPN